MLGRTDKLRKLFDAFSSQVVFHKWGDPSDPLPQCYANGGYSRLFGRPAYQLDIHAIKDRPLPKGYSNRWATRGRLAQMLNHPISWNVYRVMQRIRLLN